MKNTVIIIKGKNSRKFNTKLSTDYGALDTWFPVRIKFFGIPGEFDGQCFLNDCAISNGKIDIMSGTERPKR